MAIGVAIHASFKIDDTIYEANMALPTSAPTGEDPFLFQVTSTAKDKPTTTLLTVAVGATHEVYVAIAPPKDLIAQTLDSDIVQALDVQVTEGDFDPLKKKFNPPNPAPAPTPAPPAA